MEMPLVEQVRSFNRTMTERIGVLNDHFLGRNHPLGEARLLWEIGEHGAEVREMRNRLGLDSAYVSRLLRSLEGQDLVKVEPSSNDGRVRMVHLTKAGLRERAELDHRLQRAGAPAAGDHRQCPAACQRIGHQGRHRELRAADLHA